VGRRFVNLSPQNVNGFF
jgi:hypothetical protein